MFINQNNNYVPYKYLFLDLVIWRGKSLCNVHIALNIMQVKGDSRILWAFMFSTICCNYSLHALIHLGSSTPTNLNALCLIFLFLCESLELRFQVMLGVQMTQLYPHCLYSMIFFIKKNNMHVQRLEVVQNSKNKIFKFFFIDGK